jgi:hypothetical protein
MTENPSAVTQLETYSKERTDAPAREYAEFLANVLKGRITGWEDQNKRNTDGGGILTTFKTEETNTNGHIWHEVTIETVGDTIISASIEMTVLDNNAPGTKMTEDYVDLTPIPNDANQFVLYHSYPFHYEERTLPEIDTPRAAKHVAELIDKLPLS